MTENTLTVKIMRPVGVVYFFTIMPENTPRWVPGIKKEVVDGMIRIGATYRNQDDNGVWRNYKVVQNVPEKVFELISEDGYYHVRYTYQSLSEDETELTYHEWQDNGDLEVPFNQAILDGLKKTLEEQTR